MIAEIHSNAWTAFLSRACTRLDLPTGVRTLLADASDASDASFHMNSPRAHAHARRAHTILSVGSVGSVGKVGRGVEIFST